MERKSTGKLTHSRPITKVEVTSIVVDTGWVTQIGSFSVLFRQDDPEFPIKYDHDQQKPQVETAKRKANIRTIISIFFFFQWHSSSVGQAPIL